MYMHIYVFLYKYIYNGREATTVVEKPSNRATNGKTVSISISILNEGEIYIKY